MLWILGACTHVPEGPQPSEWTGAKALDRDPTLSICGPCTRKQAREWAEAAESDVGSGLQAANCYLFLATQEADRSSTLADAQKGRTLAKNAVDRAPQSALAHYLYAYLTGLEAENDPLHGLERVPVIEQAARTASELNPSIDAGGPDRMLGELYLRAPGMPVSIGDAEKAVAHYRRAVSLAPDYPENRLGLAEALLELEEMEPACLQLHQLLLDLPPAELKKPTWDKTLKLLKRVCITKGPEG